MSPLNRGLSRGGRVRRAGATVVEIAVGAFILSALLGAVGLTVLRGNALYREGRIGADLEARARRMVDGIVAELIDADRSSLVLVPPAPFAAASIDYARGIGVAGGALAVGPTRRIRVRLVSGEVDDGLDNDGNGLVDEGRLELLPDVAGAPARTVGLGGWVREYLEGEIPNGLDDNGNGLVDERGLCLTFDPPAATLTIRLTLERPAPGGRVVIRTAQTTVQLRND